MSLLLRLLALVFMTNFVNGSFCDIFTFPLPRHHILCLAHCCSLNLQSHWHVCCHQTLNSLRHNADKLSFIGIARAERFQVAPREVMNCESIERKDPLFLCRSSRARYKHTSNVMVAAAMGTCCAHQQVN